MMRGLNMRDMKAQQLGRRPRGRPTAAAAAARRAETPPDDEQDACLDLDADEVLEDRGDGVRVARRVARVSDDRVALDFPDEPPPGWGEL